MRYIRAFFTALRMTLRGERPPQSPYASLIAWVQQGETLVNAVYRAADNYGFAQAAREALKLRINSRNMSAETLLGTVRHHVSHEYPLLLRSPSSRAVTAIHANNVNDRYFVERLQAADELQAPAIQQAFALLRAHLEAIPSSEFTQNSGK